MLSAHVYVCRSGCGRRWHARGCGRVIPERERAYPWGSMFGVLPTYGLFLRHAEGVTLDNLDLGVASPDARPAILVESVRGLETRRRVPHVARRDGLVP
ncbi:MAG TPA: hypothetical protein PK770_07535 [Kiritimatiellia bacterium]|nr:hypothetical protein [Kiritimatiellia bacterium]HPC49394.1 hypothetical protein [Kiritimatiellia bacterium]